jgi:hypothetical protein
MIAATLAIGTNAIAQSTSNGASKGTTTPRPPATSTAPKPAQPPRGASPAKPTGQNSTEPATPAPKSPITQDDGQLAAKKSENKAPTAAPAAVPATLEPKATAIESLGMTLHLPKGAVFARDMQSATPAFVLDDQQDPPRYRCRLSILVPSALDATCASLVTDHLHAMQDRGQKPTILANELLPCGDRDGRLFYASVPLDASTTAITGWYLVQMGPSQFLVCSVVSSELDFPPVRATLRDFFGSWDFADRDALAVRQVERLKAGSELLERIDPALLRSAASPAPRWFRIHRLDADGRPAEIGYMTLSSRPGLRGEVDPSRDPQRFAGIDRDEGLLTEIQSRTVLSIKDGAFTDTAARFWTAWDRQSESWSAIATDRIGKKARSFAETGLRPPPTAAQPVPVLHVMTTSARIPDGTELEWEPDPRYYLSQGELWHLGRLLPRDGSFSGEFGMAAYDGRLAQLPIRQDRWTRDGKQWLLESQPGRDKPVERSWFDANGLLVKRVEADGTTTELSTQDDIKARWKAAGLPIR